MDKKYSTKEVHELIEQDLERMKKEQRNGGATLDSREERLKKLQEARRFIITKDKDGKEIKRELRPTHLKAFADASRKANEKRNAKVVERNEEHPLVRDKKPAFEPREPQISLEKMIGAFRLENPDLLKAKFEEAKDTGPHSLFNPAHFAMYLFYNIENKPVTIDGKKFNKSFFAVKAPLDGHEAKLNTALISEDKKTILFLDLSNVSFVTKRVRLPEESLKEGTLSKELFDGAVKEGLLKIEKGVIEGTPYCKELALAIGDYLALTNFVGGEKIAYKEGDPREVINTSKFTKVEFRSVFYGNAKSATGFEQFATLQGKLNEMLNPHSKKIVMKEPLNIHELFKQEENKDCLQASIKGLYGLNQ